MTGLCGTYRGYLAHRHAVEVACWNCWLAYADRRAVKLRARQEAELINKWKEKQC